MVNVILRWHSGKVLLKYYYLHHFCCFKCTIAVKMCLNFLVFSIYQWYGLSYVFFALSFLLHCHSVLRVELWTSTRYIMSRQNVTIIAVDKRMLFLNRTWDWWLNGLWLTQSRRSGRQRRCGLISVVTVHIIVNWWLSCEIVKSCY